MENPLSGSAERMVDDVRQYIDLRLNALKLSLIERLSLNGAGFIGFILFLFLLQTGVLFLLAVLAWLIGAWIGSYVWGAVIIGCVMIILGVVVLLLGRKIFVDLMVGILARLFFNDNDGDHEQRR